MAWTNSASDAEMKSVLTAIDLLEQRPFITHMSYEMIARASCTLKATAVRWIIPMLVDKGYITQLTVGEQKVPRYFYKLTAAGKKFMGTSN